MLRWSGLLVSLLLLAAAPARAQFVAEQITTVPAAEARLFGGTDADGGIGDWYLSNGVVEAIIDGVGPQDDLVGLLGAAAPPKQSEAAFTGGSLIDLGLVGANNDQLAQMFTVGGLSTSNFILYDTITSSTTASSATLKASGRLLGFEGSGVTPDELALETEYTAAGSDSFLTVTTRVTNGDPSNTAAGLGGFLDVFIWVSRAIVPFSPFVHPTFGALGFNHPLLDFANLVAALESPPFAAGPGNVRLADGVMDPPSGAPAGEVSYGLLGVSASLGATTVPVGSLFGVSSNLITAFGNPPLGSLPPGATLSYTRRVYVGGRNDVASVASAMIKELSTRSPGFATGTISGDVDAEDADGVEASVIATRTGGPAIGAFPNGVPVTHFRTSPVNGAFGQIRLPVGTYSLEFRAAERDPVVVSGVVVTAGANTVVSIPPLSGLGSVAFEVFERAPGVDPLVPAKVTFKGARGTPDPQFNKDIEAVVFSTGGPPEDIQIESFNGGAAQQNFLYLADGTGGVQLRPGRYEVFISRGPEYTVARKRLLVRASTRTRTVRARLRRVVDTAGTMSADFHIHSARSLDSSAPLQDRVASFAAEGLEVMVSSDHDYHVDYAPIIAGLGIGSHITSVVGTEMTSSVPNPPGYPDAIGHINAWPLPVLPLEKRDGSIEDEFVAPNWVFTRLRLQGADVVQYNHPRAGVSGLTVIGFFNNIGYDPTLPIDVPPNDILLDDDITGASGISNPFFRNIDFDVMEILNGTSVRGYLAVRRDWLSLLNQLNTSTSFGDVPFIAGTAVSDSHRLTVEAAGYGRTYVLGVGDDPASLPVATFHANTKAGRSFGTTAPFIEFSVEDTSAASAGLGETLVPATGDVVLKIRVQATNWIPVEEVRVIRNGFVDPTLVFDESTVPAVRAAPRAPWTQSTSRVVRFEAEIPLTLTEDTYFIVEAGADLSPLPSAPPFADTIVPDLIPLAFTNPIFVDLAGDDFDPPGLPVLAAAPVGPGAPEEAARAPLVPTAPSSYAELSPEKRAEVLHHLPLHKIVLPAPAEEE